MTVSVAAITATGAWYGAGMAIKRDAAKVCLLCFPGKFVLGSESAVCPARGRREASRSTIAEIWRCRRENRWTSANDVLGHRTTARSNNRREIRDIG